MRSSWADGSEEILNRFLSALQTAEAASGSTAHWAPTPPPALRRAATNSLPMFIGDGSPSYFMLRYLDDAFERGNSKDDLVKEINATELCFNNKRM